MNYLPWVSWGVYGATTAKQRANYFASWGITGSLSAGLIVEACYIPIIRRRRR